MNWYTNILNENIAEWEGRGFKIGPPKESPMFSSFELDEMGISGAYQDDVNSK